MRNLLLPEASARKRTSRRPSNPAPARENHSRRSLARRNLIFLRRQYIEQTYLAWRADPNSVHKSWDLYFRSGALFLPHCFVSKSCAFSLGVYSPPSNLVADYSSHAGSAAPAATSAGGAASEQACAALAKALLAQFRLSSDVLQAGRHRESGAYGARVSSARPPAR